MKWLSWVCRETWAPLLFLILVVGLWDIVIRVFGIIPLTLPPPTDVFGLMWDDRVELLTQTWITARAALLGLGASLVVGIVVAILFSTFSFIRRGAYPYAVFLQTVPVIAIAPLVIIWFGRGLNGIVVVSFVLSVFPIITNATTGLLSVDKNLEELFELHDAAWWQRLFKLRLPSSVPFILAGLQIASGTAVIGAIVGEYFVGNVTDDFGLGHLIHAKQDGGRTDLLFSAVLTSTLLGVAMFAVVSLFSRFVLSRWFGRGKDGT